MAGRYPKESPKTRRPTLRIDRSSNLRPILPGPQRWGRFRRVWGPCRARRGARFRLQQKAERWRALQQSQGSELALRWATLRSRSAAGQPTGLQRDRPVLPRPPRRTAAILQRLPIPIWAHSTREMRLGAASDLEFQFESSHEWRNTTAESLWRKLKFEE